MLAKKRMLVLILTFPVIALVAHLFVIQAPGYTPADNAQLVAKTMQVNLQSQHHLLNQNLQTSKQLSSAISQLTQQITSMQTNYQNHLLKLSQQGLINLHN